MEYATTAPAPSLHPVCVPPQWSCSEVSLWRMTGDFYLSVGWMLSGIASAWSTQGNWYDCLRATLRCFMALIDPEWVSLMLTRSPLPEKEEKHELFFSYLHFKCVQELAILDLIKWTSAFRIMGKQDVWKPLCPLGSGQRAELHQQCLHSHIPESLSWETWTPSGQDFCQVPLWWQPPDDSLGLSTVGSTF